MKRRCINVVFALSMLLLPVLSLVADEYRIPLDAWRWKSVDGSAVSQSDYDDRSWESVVLPARLSTGEPGTVFWLRTRFTVPADAPDRLWLLTDKMGVAMEVWVNGVYAGQRGQIEPWFDLRATHYGAILLPTDMVRPGAVLELALRCAYNGSVSLVQIPSVGDERAMHADMRTGNFWNGGLYSLLAALCVFLGVYFMLQYGFKRSEKTNLYFALTLLFLSVYMAELGTTFWPFPWPWVRSLARASLMISMFFVLPFYITFFGFFKHRLVTPITLVVGLTGIVLFVATSGDETVLRSVFNASCGVLFIPITISAYIAIRALRSGQKEAWPVLFAIVLGIILAAHDAIYSSLDIAPFAWLQGIAFFALDLSVFIALSMRQTKLKGDLEAYAREVGQKTHELAASFERIEEVGRAVAGIGRELDSAANLASMAAQASSARCHNIGEEISRQAEDAQKADTLVEGFVASIERITESLLEQSGSLSRTAAAATELSSGADTVDISIAETARFTGGLAELTDSGEQAAYSLDDAMKRVSHSTENISEIVGAVEAFAEQTSVLAMNAAIEAAHAGAAGRGFAVIANEVQKLAESQTEQASRIRQMVNEIVEEVAEGSGFAERVRDALREIASGANGAASRIGEVSYASREQKRASDEISSSMEALAASGSVIHGELNNQSENAVEVRKAVAAMAQKAQSVLAATRAIVDDGATLAKSIKGLGELASRSRTLTAHLVTTSTAVNGDATENVRPAARAKKAETPVDASVVAVV